MTIKQEKAIKAIIKKELNQWPSETKGFQIFYSKRVGDNRIKTYMNFNRNGWGWAGTSDERKIIDAIFSKMFSLNDEGYIEVII